MADRQHHDDSQKVPHGAPPREADTGRPHEAAAELEQDYGDFVAETETGARQPVGFAGKLLIGVALAWSLFQLYYASPLPYVIGSVLNSTEARSVHLAFAIFLAFTAYPAFKRSPRGHIPVLDWIFALVGAACAGYLFVFYRDLSTRPGLPITQDLVVAVIGMILLLEATRRALGRR